MRIGNRASALATLALLCVGTSACGDDRRGTVDAGAMPMGDAGPMVDAGPTVDAGSDPVDAAPPHDARPIDPPDPDPGYLIYVDFSGHRFRSLFGDEHGVPPFIMPSTSALAGEQFVSIDAFDVGWMERRQALIDAVTQRLRAIFEPFDVQFVTRRPEGTGFATIKVGGNVEDSGDSRGSCSILGHAFQLCGPPTDGVRRGFVHSACFRQSDEESLRNHLAKVIAHELGHLFSLQHSDSGGIMTSGHIANEWLSGNVVESDPLCRSGAQDSHAVLLTQLGARIPRVEPPPSEDLEPPALDVWPAADETVGSLVSPCAITSDASDLENVFVQIYTLPGGAPPDFPYMLLTQQWLDGPEFQFDEVDLSGWVRVAFRFTATDTAGNLIERRHFVEVDPDAPAATCPL